MDAPPPTTPPPATPSRRRPTPWLVRTAGSWSKLLLAAAVLRVLAAVGGWLPATALSDGVLGIGSLAIAGAVLAALGFLVSVVAWGRCGSWTRLGLLVLFALHSLTLVVFPTRSLLARLQTEEALFFVETEDPVFALTIDDGLDPESTPRLLEVLAEHDAKATFFVLGESLEAYPELAAQCLDEGHELANHQMTDTPAVKLGDEKLESRLREADRLLRQITEPKWFRPGGGIPTERSQAVARQLGYRLALGSVFPFDSHLPSPGFVRAYVSGRAGPGEIVVVHDRGERGLRTAAALSLALPELAQRGLKAVTLSQLVALRR